jgi:hypothetical protein
MAGNDFEMPISLFYYFTRFFSKMYKIPARQVKNAVF